MFAERYFSKSLVVVWKGVLILRMKIRFITKITRENIPYCERIMEISEVRHLDEVRRNFGDS